MGKRGLTPKLGKGFHHARADLQPNSCFVVYAGHERYSLSKGVEAISLASLAEDLSLL